MPRHAPFAVAVIALLVLTGCADPAGSAPSQTPAPAPAHSSSAGAAPTSQGMPSADPTEGWHVVETADGLFRWRVPADWTVVDASFEAEDGLGHVNDVTIVSDIGQELARFGSAYYGDRGGTCAGDEDGMVPALVHLDETVALGGRQLSSARGPAEAGRIVALTSQFEGDRAQFFAGFTQDEVEADRVSCLIYGDVPVPEGYPQTSFRTTWDLALWEVDSFEQGAAYAETEEFRELMDVFRSLELTGA
ncbi:hypothetical protein [Agrococcus sp. HG114]|uniref:hypothetical protein n=1 Tax=Agrococcus sp. HG114 TaxID=2969757 RepID=UPI00215A70BE|nr:hypothetical protein [Agrococcus sp. HG114]MCR8670050.1 hypothetical protein [Agrococcus sp. HG114]